MLSISIESHTLHCIYQRIEPIGFISVQCCELNRRWLNGFNRVETIFCTLLFSLKQFGSSVHGLALWFTLWQWFWFRIFLTNILEELYKLQALVKHSFQAFQPKIPILKPLVVQLGLQFNTVQLSESFFSVLHKTINSNRFLALLCWHKRNSLNLI